MFLLYFFLIRRPPPKSTLFPYTTSSDLGSFNFDPRSAKLNTELGFMIESPKMAMEIEASFDEDIPNSAYEVLLSDEDSDRKSTRLNSSHVRISYAVFCLKKKIKNNESST